MTEENRKEEEAALLAYRFAEDQADPAAARRHAEMERDELRGEILGGAILGEHMAQQERKRRQHNAFFAFVERNRQG